MGQRNLQAPIVWTAFFISGAAGLVYEVVWARYLDLVLGGTTYAHTMVLAAYMGGLALGSWFFGRLADRIKRPLRLYVLLECGVALWGLLFPLLDSERPASEGWRTNSSTAPCCSDPRPSSWGARCPC